jgi:hypothetical protein
LPHQYNFRPYKLNNLKSLLLTVILSAISQMGKDLRTKSPGDTIAALVRDINGTDGSHPNTIEGRKHKSGSETVDLLVAIDNFEKGGMPWKNNTGEAGSAKGED